MFLIATQVAFSQRSSGEITYRVKVLYNPNLTEETKMEIPELYEDFANADSIIENYIDFKLLFHDGKTLFKSGKENRAISGFNQDAINLAFESSNCTSQYYFNYANQEFVKQFSFWRNDLLIVDNFPFQKWELTNESRSISGYTCYKAIIKQYDKFEKKAYNKVAWYTTEIPLPYGPLSYNGLPGLIIRLDERYLSYYVTEINLGKLSTVKKPTFGKKMTFQQFNEKKNQIVERTKEMITNEY